jgi:hypothetical protein
MSGMLNTPKEAESKVQLTAELYRTIMVSELVARKVGLDEVRTYIRALLKEYETKLDPTQQSRI